MRMAYLVSFADTSVQVDEVTGKVKITVEDFEPVNLSPELNSLATTLVTNAGIEEFEAYGITAKLGKLIDIELFMHTLRQRMTIEAKDVSITRRPQKVD